MGLSKTMLARVIGASAVSVPPIEYLLVVGASQEVDALGTNDAAGAPKRQALVDYVVSAVPAAAGKFTVYNESVSGRPTGGAKINWDGTIKAKYHPDTGTTPLPRGGRTLVLFNCYGNDVTPRIPYDASDDSYIASVKADIEAMIDDCIALGWDWHLADLSFRDYNDNTMETPSNGAYPFLQRIGYAITRTQPFTNRKFADGTSWLDLYHLARDNAEALVTDGIHFKTEYVATFRKWIADRIVIPSWTRTPPVSVKFDAPASDAVGSLATFSFDYSNIKTVGNPNTKLIQGLQGATLSGFARDRNTGARLPWFVRNDAASCAQNMYGRTDFSVPGYFDTADLANGRAVSGTAVGTFYLCGLTPGASYEVRMTGLRDNQDANRVTKFTIIAGTVSGAATQTMDAQRPASGTTAPYVTFTVTPTASGRIDFTFTNEDVVTSTKLGYLSAVSIKRVA
jgi:hypothetical protein